METTSIFPSYNDAQKQVLSAKHPSEKRKIEPCYESVIADFKYYFDRL